MSSYVEITFDVLVYSSSLSVLLSGSIAEMLVSPDKTIKMHENTKNNLMLFFDISLFSSNQIIIFQTFFIICLIKLNDT